MSDPNVYDDRILPIDEAAELAGVSRASFYRLFGGIKRYQLGVGNKMGVLLSELTERIRQREQHPLPLPVAGAQIRPNYFPLHVGTELDWEASAHKGPINKKYIRVIPSLVAPHNQAIIPLRPAGDSFSFELTVINRAGAEVKIVCAEGEVFEGRGTAEIVTRAPKISLIPLKTDQEHEPDTWDIDF